MLFSSLYMTLTSSIGIFVFFLIVHVNYAILKNIYITGGNENNQLNVNMYNLM